MSDTPDLFNIQSAIYNTYHADNAKVFYNKDGAWQILCEVCGTGQRVQVEPYYIIIKLPGEEKAEFVRDERELAGDTTL